MATGSTQTPLLSVWVSTLADIYVIILRASLSTTHKMIRSCPGMPLGLTAMLLRTTKEAALMTIPIIQVVPALITGETAMTLAPSLGTVPTLTGTGTESTIVTETGSGIATDPGTDVLNSFPAPTDEATHLDLRQNFAIMSPIILLNMSLAATNQETWTRIGVEVIVTHMTAVVSHQMIGDLPRLMIVHLVSLRRPPTIVTQGLFLIIVRLNHRLQKTIVLDQWLMPPPLFSVLVLTNVPLVLLLSAMIALLVFHLLRIRVLGPLCHWKREYPNLHLPCKTA